MFAYTNTNAKSNNIWTSLPAHIGYFITDRLGGSSREPYDFFNIAMHVGDCVDDVLFNRQALARSQNMYMQRLVFASQVHGTDVKEVGEGDLNYDIYTVVKECDGLITKAKEMAVIVQVADCVPILFYDGNTQKIGALHAGWRGVVNGILPKAITQLKNDTFDPAQFHVLLGPSIASCCYEVGDEVIKAVKNNIPEPETCLEVREKRTFFDLRKALLNQLELEQIPSQNISVSEDCTCCYPQRFFSYRHAAETGRFCAGIYFRK